MQNAIPAKIFNVSPMLIYIQWSQALNEQYLKFECTCCSKDPEHSRNDKLLAAISLLQEQVKILTDRVLKP